MTQNTATAHSLLNDLRSMGIQSQDGIFVHASQKAIGDVQGGAGSVVRALLDVVGPQGLVAMPGFSSDAYLPADLDYAASTANQIAEIEKKVTGFDAAGSSAQEMGIIAETFRCWSGTERSRHPTTSVCINGAQAEYYTRDHSLEWATGGDSPFGHLMKRPNMKILLIGVGWNCCSALHTAEFFARPQRTKIRRFKTGPGDSPWQETPDVADDMNRLFPDVGIAFEGTGRVTHGKLGSSDCRLCEFSELVDYASTWISAANSQSGDLH